MTMTETVTAIYENGVLRPLRPLKLKERQRVQVRVIPSEDEDRREAILQFLIDDGLIQPLTTEELEMEDSVSEEERRQLADILGKAPGKPLSEIVIEERGDW